jgi:hypothetical protein
MTPAGSPETLFYLTPMNFYEFVESRYEMYFWRVRPIEAVKDPI